VTTVPWVALVVVFLATALTTAAVLPLVLVLAKRVGAIVVPHERKVHQKPTPTLGGAAMFVGIAVGLGVASGLQGFRGVFDSAITPVGVLLAAAVVFLTGLVDDIKEVSAPGKIAGLVLGGSVLSLAGLTIVNLPLPFVGFTVLAPDMAALISVLWVIVMANAINLIDGLDGLAAGVVFIAALAFLVYGLRLQHVGIIETGNIGPLLAVITMGVCAGFLPYNLHPARIFMGDSGALLLGLLMASSTIAVGGQSDDSYAGQSWFFFAPLVIPLFILAIPLLDMAFSVLRRARARSGIATADKDHLHHRLLRLGHGQRISVAILWGFTALLSLFVLVPVLTQRGIGMIPVALAALVLLLFTLLLPRLSARRRSHEVEDGPNSEQSDVDGNEPADPTESADSNVVEFEAAQQRRAAN
jgi:UDP-GlcNAc:undecaprenyl-phosphate GlcNAc-1-phosphate transferase